MANVKNKMKLNKATHEEALVPGQEGRRGKGEEGGGEQSLNNNKPQNSNSPKRCEKITAAVMNPLVNNKHKPSCE